MTNEPPVSSRRRAELLDACYGYALAHGLAGVSLRPLAADIGTSPRVLLYLFGSKDQLVRQVLARARHEQITQMVTVLDAAPPAGGDRFEQAVARLRTWLTAPEQRDMARLTYEAFLYSLRRDPGPWAGFAAESAADWREMLINAQPDTPRETAVVRATGALALIRGLVLELLAGTDPAVVEAAATSANRVSVREAR